LRENREQAVKHLLLKTPPKSLRVKGRSKNAQAKRYGVQAHPRPASQYRR
jgi:hypothetical protein